KASHKNSPFRSWTVVFRFFFIIPGQFKKRNKEASDFVFSGRDCLEKPFFAPASRPFRQSRRKKSDFSPNVLTGFWFIPLFEPHKKYYNMDIYMPRSF
ncbi:MAG: hypothetical protein ACI4I8_02860, partial [Oscillospiraceae bacterium]